jgi:hypothetical protein
MQPIELGVTPSSFKFFVYYLNAVTNLHIRSEIRNSNLTNLELAIKYNTSITAVQNIFNIVIIE